MVGAGVVRQVVGEDVDAGQLGHGAGSGGVRAVAEADRHRAVVEPEAVAAVGPGAFGQAAENRHAEALEFGRDQVGLGRPHRLAHPAAGSRRRP